MRDEPSRIDIARDERLDHEAALAELEVADEEYLDSLARLPEQPSRAKVGRRDYSIPTYPTRRIQ